MLNYAVVQIKSRQYKVEPNKSLIVDYLGEIKNFECEQVLLKNEDGKLLVGEPFLKEKLDFEVISSKREPKIRVFKYHAKANTRKIRGSRRVVSEIKLKV